MQITSSILFQSFFDFQGQPANILFVSRFLFIPINKSFWPEVDKRHEFFILSSGWIRMCNLGSLWWHFFENSKEIIIYFKILAPVNTNPY